MYSHACPGRGCRAPFVSALVLVTFRSPFSSSEVDKVGIELIADVEIVVTQCCGQGKVSRGLLSNRDERTALSVFYVQEAAGKLGLQRLAGAPEPFSELGQAHIPDIHSWVSNRGLCGLEHHVLPFFGLLDPNDAVDVGHVCVGNAAPRQIAENGIVEPQPVDGGVARDVHSLSLGRAGHCFRSQAESLYPHILNRPRLLLCAVDDDKPPRGHSSDKLLQRSTIRQAGAVSCQNLAPDDDLHVPDNALGGHLPPGSELLLCICHALYRHGCLVWGSIVVGICIVCLIVVEAARVLANHKLSDVDNLPVVVPLPYRLFVWEYRDVLLRQVSVDVLLILLAQL
mmetsp:Transcript_8221/g.24725  ORF Transcript_8221/g.24725 Transcript_8221/m.24725 type:complete len:341 (-) Transcript_8221:1398-2420(-)